MDGYSGKFGGKQYEFYGSVESESQADYRIKELRKEGYKARKQRISSYNDNLQRTHIWFVWFTK